MLTDTGAGAGDSGRDRLEWVDTRLIGSETVLNEFIGPPLRGALVGL